MAQRLIIIFNNLFMLSFHILLLFHNAKSDMVFEMQLLEFKNPLNNTYSNKPCGFSDNNQSLSNNNNNNHECKTSFLFCLVDLPFRNPQNCSLGDYTTPILGSNHIRFISESNKNEQSNYTYKFLIRKLPSQGIGMMIEVRDMIGVEKWEPIDFYTSALADVPLSSRSINSTYVVKKRFSSLFNHNSTLLVRSKLYCAPNYFGSNCENFCDEIYNQFYTCDPDTGVRVCKDGFMGDDCQIPNICSTMPCLNEGICESIDGINYSCKCKNDFYGLNCEKVKQIDNNYKTAFENPCFSMPCFNNGKCNIVNGNQFQCECQSGFHGVYCEADLRRCTSSPCSKNCQCIEIPLNMSYECKCTENKFSAISSTKSIPQASRTYLLKNRFRNTTLYTSLSSTSTSTTIKTTAVTSPISNNPSIVPFSSYDSKKLQEHFTSSTKLPSLSIKNTTLNDISKSNYSNITTKSKYDYDTLSSTELVDNTIGNRGGIETQQGSKKNSLKNLNTPAPKTKSSPKADSSEIQIADFENKKACIDFNPCKHGKCILNNETSEFECECNVGYMGPFCDLIRHPCDFKPCENGICEIVGDLYYKCLCKPNYTGVNCHIEIKPCDSHTCLNGGKCKSGTDTMDADFVGCDCPANFTGTYCENQITEKNLCEPNPCQNDAICNIRQINYQQTLECLCAENYYGDFCEKTRETCKTLQCLNGGKCIETNMTYAECKCATGFTGVRCEVDIDECTLLEKPCRNNSICRNQIGSYECVCPPGLSGPECSSKLNPCYSANSPCKNNATCLFNEISNEVSCQCLIGSNGKFCENTELVDPCRNPKACLNDGVCILDERSLKGYTCQCGKGFDGEFCERRPKLYIPHTCEISNPCINNGRCYRKNNNNDTKLMNNKLDYHCVCQHGFTGANCEIEIDPCVDSPCRNGATCQRKEHGQFFCECALGFHGIFCDADINVCEFGVCKNGGKCIDGIGANFTCICEPGFTGKSCQFETRQCEKRPCMNGGSCIELAPRGYKCACTENFTGANCEVDISTNEFKKLQHQNDKCLNYCASNSTCKMSSGGQPMCICQSGQFGERCEKSIKAYCENKQCNNGGSCIYNEFSKSNECFCLKGYSGDLCEERNICKQPQTIPCYNNGTCLVSSDNKQHCECAIGFSGDNCELSLRISSNQSTAIDALTNQADAVAIGQDNGVWLIVIVFGYIFGLFLIFVIIWFIWYGTSLKRRNNDTNHYGSRASHIHGHYGTVNGCVGNLLPTSSNNHFSQYDYSTQSSLRRPLAGKKDQNSNQPNNNNNTTTLTDDNNSSYSPIIAVRTNPAFNSKDEILMYQQSNNSNNNTIVHQQSISQYADDLSTSTSFVHTYQHRI